MGLSYNSMKFRDFLNCLRSYVLSLLATREATREATRIYHVSY